MSQSPLQHIQALYSQEELDCTLLSASQEVPYERLIVYLGTDHKERERILEITAAEQQLDDTEEPILRIQFQIAFPFSYKNSAVHEVSSVLLFINRMIELPGLELSEEQNRLYYRYVLLTSAKDVTRTLILAITGIITMILDLFADTIEKIACGQATFNNLLEDMSSLLKKL